MFDLDTFLADCIDAVSEPQPRLAVKDVLERAVADPDQVARSLRPERGGIERLHVSPELTVLHVVWAPGMRIYPHDHRMWATIGIYGGQEDNTFYRRSPEGVVASGGTQLRTRDVALLGDDTIHAVSNPRRTFTGAIHIYGGDITARPGRSEWDEDTAEEVAYDFDRTRRHFEAANGVA